MSKNKLTINKHSKILNCRIDRVTFSEALANVEEFIAKGYMHHGCGINADQIVKINTDKTFKKIIDKCDLVTADGISVLWASKIFGEPVPERIASIDLFERLLPISAEKGYKIFLLGAREHSVVKAKIYYEKKNPGLKIVGFHNGFWSSDEEADIVKLITKTRPDMLFIAITSPIGEYFVERNRNLFKNIPFVLGVGGAFDIAAGITKRAPVWMRKIGFEWIFRFIQEPKRMLYRCTISNMIFLLLVCRDIINNSFHRCLEFK